MISTVSSVNTAVTTAMLSAMSAEVMLIELLMRGLVLLRYWIPIIAGFIYLLKFWLSVFQMTWLLRVRTEFARFAFSFYAPTIWNSLQSTPKTTTLIPLGEFKSMIINHPTSVLIVSCFNWIVFASRICIFILVLINCIIFIPLASFCIFYVILNCYPTSL